MANTFVTEQWKGVSARALPIPDDTSSVAATGRYLKALRKTLASYNATEGDSVILSASEATRIEKTWQNQFSAALVDWKTFIYESDAVLGNEVISTCWRVSLFQRHLAPVLAQYTRYVSC
jgi:hypothetical protein